MIKIPKSVVSTIENSCEMNNVRGARDWRSMNDGKGRRIWYKHVKQNGSSGKSCLKIKI